MSTKTTLTQVKFRYTTKVVNLVTVLRSLRIYSGMTFEETRQLFDQAQNNKRRFFTVDALDTTAAKDLARILEENDCQVKYN
jgi:hypothetical protein